MAFWAHPTNGTNLTSAPMMDAEEEGGLDIPMEVQGKLSSPVILTDEQRKLAIAKARQPHSGKVSFDVRILIVVGVLLIVGVVLYLFFANMSKARGIIHQQIIAKQTAVTLVSQLDPLLPRQQATVTKPPSHTSSVNSPQVGKPAVIVTPTTHPYMSRALASIDTMSNMVDENRSDVWVIDRQAWVYADSRNPGRAVHPQTKVRPNFNLTNLNTSHGNNKDSTAPSNVGSAILQAAEHGPGLVNFLVPAQGVSGAAVSSVTVFVQPIPGTDFLVVVKVGHRSDNDQVKPVRVSFLDTTPKQHQASAATLPALPAVSMPVTASATPAPTPAPVLPALHQTTPPSSSSNGTAARLLAAAVAAVSQGHAEI